MSANGIVWESVIFRERSIEVSYTEERNRGDGVALVYTVVIGNEKLPTFVADLHEALGDLVDEAQVQLRNPPQRITRGAPDADDG